MVLSVFALFCLGYAFVKKVPVYEGFVDGAREGVRTAAGILPSLMVMLAAIRVWEESGLNEALCAFLLPVTEKIGLPAEVVPLMLMRPLSGSGALAMVENIMEKCGPDSRESLLAGVMMGSSETIFYTTAVYLSAAKVKHARHTIFCALMACLAGYIGAILCCP